MLKVINWAKPSKRLHHLARKGKISSQIVWDRCLDSVLREARLLKKSRTKAPKYHHNQSSSLYCLHYLRELKRIQLFLTKKMFYIALEGHSLLKLMRLSWTTSKNSCKQVWRLFELLIARLDNSLTSEVFWIWFLLKYRLWGNVSFPLKTASFNKPIPRGLLLRLLKLASSHRWLATHKEFMKVIESTLMTRLNLLS